MSQEVLLCHSVDSHTLMAKMSAMTNSGYSFPCSWGSHGGWLKQSVTHLSVVRVKKNENFSVWMGRQKDVGIYVGSQRSKGSLTLPPQTLGMPDFIPRCCVSGSWQSLVAPCRGALLGRTCCVKSVSEQMGILCQRMVTCLCGHYWKVANVIFYYDLFCKPV